MSVTMMLCHPRRGSVCGYATVPGLNKSSLDRLRSVTTTVPLATIIEVAHTPLAGLFK
jgi:hypothetical protein